MTGARWYAMVPNIATGRSEPIAGADGQPLVLVAEDIAAARQAAKDHPLVPHGAWVISVLELDELRRGEEAVARRRPWTGPRHHRKGQP